MSTRPSFNSMMPGSCVPTRLLPSSILSRQGRTPLQIKSVKSGQIRGHNTSFRAVWAGRLFGASRCDQPEPPIAPRRTRRRALAPCGCARGTPATAPTPRAKHCRATRATREPSPATALPSPNGRRIPKGVPARCSNATRRAPPPAVPAPGSTRPTARPPAGTARPSRTKQNAPATNSPATSRGN